MPKIEIDSKASPEEVRSVQPALQSAFGIVPNGFDSTTVGPTFGQQVANSAIEAIIFSLRDNLDALHESLARIAAQAAPAEAE